MTFVVGLLSIGKQSTNAIYYLGLASQSWFAAARVRNFRYTLMCCRGVGRRQGHCGSSEYNLIHGAMAIAGSPARIPGQADTVPTNRTFTIISRVPGPPKVLGGPGH